MPHPFPQQSCSLDQPCCFSSPEELPSRVAVSAAGVAIRLFLHALVCTTGFSTYSASACVSCREEFTCPCSTLTSATCLDSHRYATRQPKDISWYSVRLFQHYSSLWVLLNSVFVLCKVVPLLSKMLYLQVSHSCNKHVFCTVFALRRTWLPFSNSPPNLLALFNNIHTQCRDYHSSPQPFINSMHFTSRSITRQRDRLCASTGWEYSLSRYFC
jgi:hypothetical protein